MASPWSGTSCTRLQKGGRDVAPLTAMYTPCHRPNLARTREPTADAVLAATHGVGPGSAAFPAVTPLSRPTPTLSVVSTLRVRVASRTPSHARSRAPALRRVTNTAAAPTSPRPHRRRPHRDGHQLPVLRPSSPATQGGGFLEGACFGQSPRRRGTRFRRGHPAPPSFSWAFRRASRITIDNTGLGCAQEATCWHGRSQSSRIRCG
jgi:hypothetical protein